jgi:hypothetical protein
MIFLEKQYQAMLILKGNLFDTFPVVLVDNLPKNKKNYVFVCVKFRSLLRGLSVLIALFLPCPSWKGLL